MYTDRHSARIREEKLARKRNQEYHRQLLWNDITQYYKTWDLQASKHNGWNSPQFLQNSADSKLILERERQKKLDERRERLRKLLAEEQKIYDEEMKEKQSKSNVNRLHPYQKIAAGEMMSSEKQSQIEIDDQQQRMEAERRNYVQWKTSQPILQDFERKRRESFIKQTLLEQMKEKQAKEETEKRMMQQLDEEIRMKQMEDEQYEKKVLDQKRQEAKELKDYLLKQMAEIKEKELETEKLKTVEKEELKLKAELEKFNIRRKEIENKRVNKELSNSLRHQYHIHLRQKNKEIQEQLMEDRKLLNELDEYLRQEKLQAELMQNLRKRINTANGFMKLYAELEKEREASMEFLFYEDARRLWNKQDSAWRTEQQGRSKLMKDTLTILQRQIKEKLDKDAERQNELMKEREEQLKNIEEANQTLKERELEIQEIQKRWMHDLEQQVKQKEQEKEREKNNELEDYRKQQMKLEEEEQRILNELKKMNMSPPFKPFRK